MKWEEAWILVNTDQCKTCFKLTSLILLCLKAHFTGEGHLCQPPFDSFLITERSYNEMG